MKLLWCILLPFFVNNAYAQINVVPMPAEVNLGKGNFVLNANTTIFIAGANLHNEAGLLNNYLQNKIGCMLQIIKGYENGKIKSKPVSNCITLNYDRLDYEIAGAYVMKVNKDNVYIGGDNDEAVFYAIQTLLQLIENNNQANTKQQITNKLLTKNNYTIPQLTIKDFPRFAFRGMHLDVGRHFYPITFIKKYIDYLATYKYNTFHWHLTEDQGWRIEIKKYPNLTKVGAFRDRTLIGRYGSNTYDTVKYGGYYTQAEVKEIVQYAANRYITVIPEIEMPGHSTAALASYPFLGCTKGPYKVMDTWGVLDDVYCAGNDSTFTFLQNVLDEVIPLFKSKYIHIGGDECPKKRWKNCAACQKRMADYNLKDEHALQSYFIQRIEKYINSKGKSIIGWDEILEGGLAPNATVMSWRGEAGGIEAAKQNHDVIMTPGSHCYLDHSQTKNEDSITIGNYLPLEKIYQYEPIPDVLSPLQAKHILGAQGNVWTEYMNNESKLEYMIFPRMIALSEVLWSPKEKRNWKEFERRLPFIFERLDKQKINYSKAYYDLESTVLPTENNDGVYWKVNTNDTNSYTQIIEPNRTYGIYDSVFIYDKNGNSTNKITLLKKQIDTNKQSTEYLLAYSNADSFPGNNYTLKAESIQKNTGKQLSKIEQSFFINKATGKKITLTNLPNKRYSGDGAFTLVNGIQNIKGLARPTEMLGFLGKDVEAIIDLGKQTNIYKVQLHSFEKRSSWIYHPEQNGIAVLVSDDGINFTMPKNEMTSILPNSLGVSTISFNHSNTSITTRYVKVVAKNFGTIPAGQPGEGTPAWLFVHEIVIE